MYATQTFLTDVDVTMDLIHAADAAADATTAIAETLWDLATAATAVL